jgi:hypothetical protein
MRVRLGLLAHACASWRWQAVCRSLSRPPLRATCHQLGPGTTSLAFLGTAMRGRSATPACTATAAVVCVHAPLAATAMYPASPPPTAAGYAPTACCAWSRRSRQPGCLAPRGTTAWLAFQCRALQEHTTPLPARAAWSSAGGAPQALSTPTPARCRPLSASCARNSRGPVRAQRRAGPAFWVRAVSVGGCAHLRACV